MSEPVSQSISQPMSECAIQLVAFDVRSQVPPDPGGASGCHMNQGAVPEVASSDSTGFTGYFHRWTKSR